jgi:hypothetical protein
VELVSMKNAGGIASSQENVKLVSSGSANAKRELSKSSKYIPKKYKIETSLFPESEWS